MGLQGPRLMGVYSRITDITLFLFFIFLKINLCVSSICESTSFGIIPFQYQSRQGSYELWDLRSISFYLWPVSALLWWDAVLPWGVIQSLCPSEARGWWDNTCKAFGIPCSASLLPPPPHSPSRQLGARSVLTKVVLSWWEQSHYCYALQGGPLA